MTERIKTWAVFGVTLVVYLACYPGRTGAFEHVVEAWAWLHGQTFVDPIQIHEHVVVRGHSYILHPPLAAVVMLPFTAIWGLAANQTLMSIVIGATGVTLAYRLTGSLWLTAFFAFGTPFAFQAIYGTSWGLCLVLSTVPTLLALILIRLRHPFQVGLFAGLAALARYDLALVWPLYPIIYVLARMNQQDSPDAAEEPAHYASDVFHYALGLLPAIVAYILYAYIRFGTFTDGSLWLWWAADTYRAPHAGNPAGPFSLAYLPWNLWSAFFMPPVFTPGFPWFRPWGLGMALTFTSPALLLALRASWREAQTWLLWAAVVLGMGAAMTVYANGMLQFGERYAIQVLPFFLALMARGGPLDQLGKVLVLVSIAMTVFGMWQIREYGFVG